MQGYFCEECKALLDPDAKWFRVNIVDEGVYAVQHDFCGWQCLLPWIARVEWTRLSISCANEEGWSRTNRREDKNGASSRHYSKCPNCGSLLYAYSSCCVNCGAPRSEGNK